MEECPYCDEYIDVDELVRDDEDNAVCPHCGGKIHVDEIVEVRYELSAAENEEAARERLGHNPWILACSNGVIELRTGTFLTGMQTSFPRTTGIAYAPEATCPRWQQFLQEALVGNGELLSFVQRAVGYTLTGSLEEQCLFLLWGDHASGKSVFLATLRAILGELATYLTPETLFKLSRPAKVGSSSHPPNPDLLALRGVRLVTAVGISTPKWLTEARVNALLAGKPITARAPHAEPETFPPQFKLWVELREKPRIAATEEALWQHMRLIPFTAQLAEEQRDPQLLNTLRQETPGILAWAVQGCLQWREKGLGSAGLQPGAAVRPLTPNQQEAEDLLDVLGKNSTVPNREN